MKLRVVHILLIGATIGISAVYHSQKNAPQVQSAEVAQPAAPSEPTPDVRSMIPATPKPSAMPDKNKPQPAPLKTPKQSPAKPSRADQLKVDQARYWDQVEKNFTRHMEQLDLERNPTKRMSLIRRIAQYVRADTLGTLDWAATLTNPTEQRAALEAIGKNALSGIGAQIEVDQTGLPKIKETTILSAVDSTGMVEPGDYISGMVKADGSTIYFKGRPIHQIVQYLRGQPGTEVQLLMERISTDGQTEPYSFDIPVLRSMIVVHPPF
jgi:C-terminal processing protease CtpA/Prc